MNAKASPFKISIAAPCPARWEDMGGDDRVRFCDHCRKNVYNISALTSDEATTLLQSQQGNLCARIYRRADGTVLTQDCPVGVARQLRRLKILASSGIAVVLLLIVHIRAFYGAKTPSSRLNQKNLLVAAGNFLSPLADRLGISPSPVMGKVCAVPSAKPPPQLNLHMGEVAATNTTILPSAHK